MTARNWVALAGLALLIVASDIILNEAQTLRAIQHAVRDALVSIVE